MLVHQALLPPCRCNGEITVGAFDILSMNFPGMSSQGFLAGESNKVVRVANVALKAEVLVLLGLGRSMPEKVHLKRLLIVVATDTELTLVAEGGVPS